MSEEITKYNAGEVQPTSPMQIIADATLNGNVPVEKMQALFDLETAYQEREAKKEFAKAITRFQHECPIVEKADMAHNKPYARMDRIWREVRPLIKECGLAVFWDSVKIDTDKKRCYMTGFLSHTSGYMQPVSYEMAIPKAITGQNEAQVEGSAQTYCKRYATCAILGIQTGNDDDGNGATDSIISAEMAKELEQIAKDAEVNKAKFFKWAHVEKFEDITVNNYSAVRHALEQKLAEKEKEAREDIDAILKDEK